MKVFRIATLAVALLAAGTADVAAQAPAGAQGGGGGGGGRGRGITALIEGITLTEAQQAKFTEIQTKYQPQLAAAREAAAGDRAAMMQGMQAINDKMYPELRAVLTAEQATVWDKNVEARKARLQQMQQGGGPGR